MAWTTSAAGRGNIAVSSMAALGHRHAANTLHSLGKGDTVRGGVIALSAFLTLAGAALPLLPHNVISALLVLAGAALMLLLAGHPASVEAGDDLDAVKSPAAAVTERRLTPAPTLFAELFARADMPTLADRAALARLTAQMSHELRTPLNAVLGFSELMANEVCGPLGSICYAGYAHDIHASGRKLLKISEDALAITSLLTSNDRRHADATTRLSHAIDEAVAFHASDLNRAGVSILCRAEGNFDIAAETQMVRQLLINLIADLTSTATPGSMLTITSSGRASTVDVDVELAGSAGKIEPEADTFSLTLARTLAELAGSRLCETTAEDGTRTLKVSFDSAAQSDFFTSEGH